MKKIAIGNKIYYQTEENDWQKLQEERDKTLAELKDMTQVAEWLAIVCSMNTFIKIPSPIEKGKYSMKTEPNSNSWIAYAEQAIKKETKNVY